MAPHSMGTHYQISPRSQQPLRRPPMSDYPRQLGTQLPIGHPPREQYANVPAATQSNYQMPRGPMPNQLVVYLPDGRTTEEAQYDVLVQMQWERNREKIDLQTALRETPTANVDRDPSPAKEVEKKGLFNRLFGKKSKAKKHRPSIDAIYMPPRAKPERFNYPRNSMLVANDLPRAPPLRQPGIRIADHDRLPLKLRPRSDLKTWQQKQPYAPRPEEATAFTQKPSHPKGHRRRRTPLDFARIAEETNVNRNMYGAGDMNNAGSQRGMDGDMYPGEDPIGRNIDEIDMNLAMPEDIVGQGHEELYEEDYEENYEEDIKEDYDENIIEMGSTPSPRKVLDIRLSKREEAFKQRILSMAWMFAKHEGYSRAWTDWLMRYGTAEMDMWNVEPPPPIGESFIYLPAILPPNEDERQVDIDDLVHILQWAPRSRFQKYLDPLIKYFGNSSTFVISYFSKQGEVWKVSSRPIGGTGQDYSGSIGAHMIGVCQSLFVGDLTKDWRFQKTHLVQNGGVSFFAGSPLVTQRGFVFGAVSMYGKHPDELFEHGDMQVIEEIAEKIGNDLTVIEARNREIESTRTSVASESFFSHAQEPDEQPYPRPSRAPGYYHEEQIFQDELHSSGNYTPPRTAEQNHQDAGHAQLSLRSLYSTVTSELGEPFDASSNMTLRRLENTPPPTADAEANCSSDDHDHFQLQTQFPTFVSDTSRPYEASIDLTSILPEPPNTPDVSIARRDNRRQALDMNQVNGLLNKYSPSPEGEYFNANESDDSVERYPVNMNVMASLSGSPFGIDKDALVRPLRIMKSRKFADKEPQSGADGPPLDNDATPTLKHIQSQKRMNERPRVPGGSYSHFPASWRNQEQEADMNKSNAVSNGYYTPSFAPSLKNMASKNFDTNEEGDIASGSHTPSVPPSLKHMASQKFDTFEQDHFDVVPDSAFARHIASATFNTNEEEHSETGTYAHSASLSLKAPQSQKFGTNHIASASDNSHTHSAKPRLLNWESQQPVTDRSTTSAGYAPSISGENLPAKLQKSHLEALSSTIHGPLTQPVAKLPLQASGSRHMCTDDYSPSVPRSVPDVSLSDLTENLKPNEEKPAPSANSRTPPEPIPEPAESGISSRSVASSHTSGFAENTRQIVPHAQFPSNVAPSDPKNADGVKMLDGHAAAKQICTDIAKQGDWDVVYVVQVRPRNPHSTDSELLAGDLLCKYLVIYARDKVKTFPPVSLHLQALRSPHHYLWDIPKEMRHEYCYGRTMVLHNEPGMMYERKTGVILAGLRRTEGRFAEEKPRSRTAELTLMVSSGREIKKLFNPDPRSGDISFLGAPNTSRQSTGSHRANSNLEVVVDKSGNPGRV